MKYPLLHTNYLEDLVKIYHELSTLSTFGHEIGLNYVVRWNKVSFLEKLQKKIFSLFPYLN